jgi:undecaprenyl-diphosphatase
MATAPTSTPDREGQPPRSPSLGTAAVCLSAAVVVLAGLAAAASDQRILWGEVGAVEEVNGLPDVAGWPLRAAMQLGTLWAAVLVVAVMAGITRASGWSPALAAGIAVALAFRLDNVLKAVIERPRPPAVLDGLDLRDHLDGFAFPSGHTTMAAALAAGLHPTVPPRWRWAPWTLVVLVGAGRLHVGVHWPLDVLGGIALGVSIGALAWLVVGLAARQ